VAGHTRAKASRLAGLKVIPARVRHDLIGASRAAVDEIFLADNTLRRQLTKLSHARAAVGIYRARMAQAEHRIYGSVFGDQALRDEIGKIVGMSGRNLGRYLNVLESLPEVQVALEAGKITLVQASRVAGLERTWPAAHVLDAV
jgi:ParB-like chromosome segregation protein Spo0J